MQSAKCQLFALSLSALTHWGRATHVCVGKLTIIGSDNGLSPGRRQAIIWTIAGILLIGSLGTNFCEILIRIQTFSFTKMHLNMSSAKWRPSCLGLSVLIDMIWRRWKYYALCWCVFKMIALYVKRRFVLYCSRARMRLRSPYHNYSVVTFLIMVSLNVSE